MNSSSRLTWAVLTIILLATAAIRLRLLDVPLERDEGEYAYVGQLLLQGVPPYAEAYNFKTPGAYFAYALILGVFGQSPAGVHLGLLVANGATILLLFHLARRLYDPVVGLAASGAFAALSLSPRVLGPAAHAEHFVLLAALAGLLVLLRAMDTDRGLAFLSSGLLFGLSFLMKQSGAVFVLFGLLYVLVAHDGPMPPGHRRLRAAGGVLVGALTPLAVVCGGLLVANTWQNFWFWGFTYGLWYASARSPARGLVNLAETLAPMVPAFSVMTGVALLGLAAVAGSRGARRHWRFMTLFTLASLLGVLPGLYFRRQYFVLLLPAVALLAGVGAVSLGRALSGTRPWTAWAVPSALMLVACLQPAYSERAALFYLSPIAVSRAMYQGNPFPEAREIGNYIKARTSADDRIAVVGSEPQIYFYANRRSATGYIYTYALMEPHPFAGRMQREMIKEIEAARPRYLVWVSVQSSWLMRPDSDKTIFRWLDEYQKREFRRVGVIDILSLDFTRYSWGDSAVAYTPRSTFWLAVFERDDGRRPNAR